MQSDLNLPCLIRIYINPPSKQEGQDGPGSLTWTFEITLANFYLSLTEKNLQEFLYVCSVQVVPIHQYHIYWQIKISQTIFEKGHSRNISMKLFQNLTSSFREDGFLRICSCSYSESSPHSAVPCLWTDQNFSNNFWERSLKEHVCKLGIRSHFVVLID